MRPKTSNIIATIAIVTAIAATHGLAYPHTAPSRTSVLPAYWTANERWAWARLLKDGFIPFAGRCPTTMPTDACSTISGAFLRDILTRSPWQDEVPPAGVNVSGARIVGQLELADARLVRRFTLSDCKIEGDVLLNNAQTTRPIAFSHIAVYGALYASGLHIDSDFDLDHSSSIAGATVFYGARFVGRLNIVDATLHDLYADNIVANALYLRSSFDEVHLSSAGISGELDLSGAHVSKTIDADGIEVAKSVFMSAKTTIIQDGVRVPPSFDGKVSLTFARIGDSLDLRGAFLSDMDLSGASIAGELRLGSFESFHQEWRAASHAATLTLRNTKVGSLVDEPTAWPTGGHLHLDGFTFSRIGGSEGMTSARMTQRGTEWWDRWSRLDNQYTQTPYTQLAAALIAAGDRGAANGIRFAGRERERDELWHNHQWTTWFGHSILRYVAGYGIGGYTFVVLAWVALFTGVGAVVLWKGVKDTQNDRRGRLWCLGAALSHLLPGVELNKEFTDFFNDPDRKRFSRSQFMFFSCISAIGWILGFILIAAMTGLTQNP